VSGRALAILAVLCAMAVTAWLAVRVPGAPEAGAMERRSLFAADEVPLDRVNLVRVERGTAPAVEYRRTDAGWSQSEPFPHPADAAALRGVIDAFAALAVTREVDPSAIDPEARAALGIDPPQARITVSWPGGERTVELGRRTVAGRAWARVAGAPRAASVDASLHAMVVDDDPRQWRSMRLHEPASGADVARIEVRYGATDAQRLVVEREGGAWRIRSPFATRADPDAVRGYLDAILRAEADAIVADRADLPEAFGLAPAERGVSLVAADGAPLGTVDVGLPVAAGAPERFGRVDGRPTVVQLGPKAIAALLPPPAFFVDPRGAAAVPADVRRIELRAAGGAPGDAPALVLERTLDRWSASVDGGPPVPADRDRVRRLLAQLCEARAPAIAFQRAPEALVRGEFTLFGAGDAVLARIRVAREEAGQWALDGDDGVLRVHSVGFDVATDPRAYLGTR
jgi:hypothetical protein